MHCLQVADFESGNPVAQSSPSHSSSLNLQDIWFEFAEMGALVNALAQMGISCLDGES